MAEEGSGQVNADAEVFVTKKTQIYLNKPILLL